MLDFQQLKTTGANLVIKTDDWFLVEGANYQYFWGKCFIRTAEEIFGFTPSGNSTNWFIQIGEGEGALVIAGCRIHYARVSANAPTAFPKGILAIIP